MPRQPEWLQRLGPAIEDLKRVTTPVVDRAALARLLGVHRRTAIRLMHRLGGYQSGRTFLVERVALVAALEEMAASENYSFEAGRRERVSAKLDALRREAKARAVIVPVAPDVWSREIADLPATVTLSPGRLEITCRGAEDLLRQLMELAQAVGNDYDGFEKRLSGKVE